MNTKIFTPVFFILYLCYASNGIAQLSFQWNVLADIEVSKGGENSHFYYNEIDAANKDLRIGLSQLNLIGKALINPQWSINGRLLLERDRGQKLDRFLVPQLNVQWLSKKRKYGLTVGSFTNPFGLFNESALSTDRNFIGLPLAYSYYVNISDKIGFSEDLGDLKKINIDGTIQWGSTHLYYGGYSTGMQFSWNIKPAKVNWKIALVTGAANLQQRFTTPLNFGITSRLKLQATYFWEQGFSVSHGSFLNESTVSTSIEKFQKYRQTLVGTDFKLGFGYLEISGEVIAAFYKVPVYLVGNQEFQLNTIDKPLQLTSIAAYVDTKYELPFIQGSYLSYRLDRLSFEALEDYTVANWDNNIWRHTLAAGYRINQHLLTRFAFSTQQTANKNWDKTQQTFRFVLTAHY